ncbi:uncharacterized protein Tco_0377263 [Tanacetum coccineum]
MNEEFTASGVIKAMNVMKEKQKRVPVEDVTRDKDSSKRVKKDIDTDMSYDSSFLSYVKLRFVILKWKSLIALLEKKGSLEVLSDINLTTCFKRDDSRRLKAHDFDVALRNNKVAYYFNLEHTDGLEKDFALYCWFGYYTFSVLISDLLFKDGFPSLYIEDMVQELRQALLSEDLGSFMLRCKQKASVFFFLNPVFCGNCLVDLSVTDCGNDDPDLKEEMEKQLVDLLSEELKQLVKNTYAI